MIIDEDLELHSVSRAFEAIQGQHAAFVDLLLATTQRPVVGYINLSTKDEQIIVRALGHTCVAIGRPVVVRDDPYSMAMEYIFAAKHEGKDEEVWRLYLDEYGNLFCDAKSCGVDPEPFAMFGRANNTYIATKIARKVAFALISSKLFMPASAIPAGE